jgi:predicted nucleic acid-binding protein
VILDTNALSAFADGHPDVGSALRRATCAAVPVVVLGEFRYGIAESRHRAAYEAWLEAALGHFDVLPVTESTAGVYADLRLALRQRGRPIPANDAAIGTSTRCRGSSEGAGSPTARHRPATLPASDAVDAAGLAE